LLKITAISSELSSGITTLATKGFVMGEVPNLFSGIKLQSHGLIIYGTAAVVKIPAQNSTCMINAS